jgi:hypothetical protein
MELPQMVTEKLAARQLSVSVAALRRWRAEGRGPRFTRLGRCLRYSVVELTRFVEQNSSPHKNPADGERIPFAVPRF